MKVEIETICLKFLIFLHVFFYFSYKRMFFFLWHFFERQHFFLVCKFLRLSNCSELQFFKLKNNQFADWIFFDCLKQSTSFIWKISSEIKYDNIKINEFFVYNTCHSLRWSVILKQAFLNMGNDHRVEFQKIENNIKICTR